MRCGNKDHRSTCTGATAFCTPPVLPDSEESLVLNVVANDPVVALRDAVENAIIIGFATVRSVDVRPAASGKWQARIEAGR